MWRSYIVSKKIFPCWFSLFFLVLIGMLNAWINEFMSCLDERVQDFSLGIWIESTAAQEKRKFGKKMWEKKAFLLFG